VGFAAIGFREIWRGISAHDGLWRSQQSKSDKAPSQEHLAVQNDSKNEKKTPIYFAFLGLEYLLMSPLFFLVIRSLDQYVGDLSARQRIRETREATEVLITRTRVALRLANPEERDRFKGELTELEKWLNDAKQSTAATRATDDLGKKSLIETKALSIGLLFAIVATHLVGRVLAEEFMKDIGRGAWIASPAIVEAIVGIALLIVLGWFYFQIEHVAHGLENHGKQEDRANEK